MKFGVFTVTKDEYDLIEDFINYYGQIFGYENIVIIDNNSTDPRTHDVYKKYSDRVKIVIEYGYEDGLQGKHFTKHMKDMAERVDYLIGLDTDEFMIYQKDNGEYTAELMSYLPEHLERLNGEQIKIRYFSNNYHTTKTTGRPVIDFTEFTEVWHGTVAHKKTLYRACDFIETYNGNHKGHTKMNKVVYSDNIIYLHYQLVGRLREYEKAYNVVVGYGYIKPTDTIQTVFDKLITYKTNGSNRGAHKIEWYLHYLIRKIITQCTPDVTQEGLNQEIKKIMGDEETYDNILKRYGKTGLYISPLVENTDSLIVFYHPVAHGEVEIHCVKDKVQ